MSEIENRIASSLVYTYTFAHMCIKKKYIYVKKRERDDQKESERETGNETNAVIANSKTKGDKFYCERI